MFVPIFSPLYSESPEQIKATMERKAKERALETALKRYPEKIIGVQRTLIDPNAPIDVNLEKRIFFMEGYKQAEKDLALTVEDIGIIHGLLLEGLNYTEVLRCFNEQMHK